MDEHTKRPVYNGYEERIMTGQELFDYFANAYECFGRHHQQIRSHRMNLSKYKKLKADGVYRVFINKLFCKIMDNETDASLYFFGYTMERPPWAKD